MVEKLQVYRAELETNKSELITKGIDVTSIELEVDRYRAELIDTANKDLNNKVAVIDSDIRCIDGIIAREREKATATSY